MSISYYEQILLPVKSELKELEKRLADIFSSHETKISPFLINFIKAPSKKIRPALSVLFSKALYGTFSDKQFLCATGAELIHNASLIHDDVVDNSDKRRGLQTLNASYDSKLAVLAGDYILSKAMDTLSKINEPIVFEIFAEAIKNITAGEINQYFLRFNEISLEEYVEKSKNKTAELFAATMLSVLKTAPKAENFTREIKKAQNFALNFGIAFQIRDDLSSCLKLNTLKPNNDDENGIYIPLASFPIEKRECLLDDYIKRASEDLGFLRDSQYKTALLELLNYLRKFDE